MVDATEIKARIEIYRSLGRSSHPSLIEQAIPSDIIPKTATKNFKVPSIKIDRIRKGAKLHVPSDYMAVLYTEKEGICRIHGIYEYTEPDNPHKIETLPEVTLKGIIRKSYEISIIYVKIGRDNFGIDLPAKIYSTRKTLGLPILTTDLMPVFYKLFKFEAQIIDVNLFLTRLADKRIEFSYKGVRDYILNQLHWIINKELSKYDLLTAIKEKMTIQRTIELEYNDILKDIALDILSFVWDYDIEMSIRDRYFWLHVQNVPPDEVMKMETLLGMSKELSKSPSTARSGAQTIIGLPYEKRTK